MLLAPECESHLVPRLFGKILRWIVAPSIATGGFSRAALIVALLLYMGAPAALVAQRPEQVGSALSFDQLVERAALIAVTTVTGRRAEWEFYGASRLIVTKVTLRVEQVLKGSASDSMTVEVLGGTVGDETQTASHVPDFRVGDRDVLFLNAHPHAVSPLVGSDEGRFRVLRDPQAGVDRVLTSGWQPLRSTAEMRGGPERVVTSMASALRLDEFATIVRDAARRLEGRR